MTRRKRMTAALGVGALVLAAGSAWAQADDNASLRVSGAVGEQSDGYLGIVGQASPAIRDQVNAINIKRRALYTDLARQRGVTIQEVGVATGCKLLSSKVGQGDNYRLPDGEWRKRQGALALPSYCG